MVYSLKASHPKLGDGIRAIAHDQLGKGIKSLETQEDGVHEAVHDARKRVKKVRGLIRLVRPALPVCSSENAYLRDAARLVSDFRDATAMIECYDRLMEAQPDGFDRSAAAPLRRQFTLERQAQADRPDVQDRLSGLRDALKATRDGLERWTLEAKGWDAIEDGLKRTYKRARDAMEVAEKSRTPVDMHDWRKRVKYHWYHARLLKNLWPEMTAPHIDAAGRLAELLGDHHDLVEFRARLPGAPLPKGTINALDKAAKAEMERLESDAFALGARLLAERPKCLAKRWGAWWDGWIDAG